ncbi:MAG: nuclear transport factor 2 family protein [Candidatus Lindowbacteria bacterium]|nr:nuclear transport factor 2 family protein [Candidatus Lindowbacteria bacterium]
MDKETMIGSITNSLTNDVIWISPGYEGRTALAGTYTGKNQVLAFLKGIFSRIDIDEVKREFDIIQGNCRNIHTNIKGYVPSTGKRFDLAVVFETRPASHGIDYVRMFFDTYRFELALTNDGGAKDIVDIKIPSTEPPANIPFDSAEIVNNIYTLFWKGQLDQAFNYCAENIVWHHGGVSPAMPFSPEYVGISGVRNYVTTLLTYTAIEKVEIVYYVREGNLWDAMVKETYRVLATGKCYDLWTINTWRINSDGKAVEYFAKPDIQEMHLAFLPD